MSYIPMPVEAEKMVLEALRAYVPDRYADLAARGALHDFAAEYGVSMREAMLERWEPPRGREGETLPERLRCEVDALDSAVHGVIDEFLNENVLRGETAQW